MVGEGLPIGSNIGQFFTDDITFQTTYTLVAGEGDGDNGLFELDADQRAAYRRTVRERAMGTGRRGGQRQRC